MKGLLGAAALSLAVSEVAGHYIFQQLSTSSGKHDVFQYVRKNSNYNSPVTDLSSNDLRCNVGASGSGTATVAVKAGESITFTADVGESFRPIYRSVCCCCCCVYRANHGPNPNPTAVYHQGPVSFYMSKAPGAASSYDGSGGWFKIKDIGPSFSGGSATWDLGSKSCSGGPPIPLLS